MDAEALIRTLTPERASFVRFARRSVGSDADAEDVVQRALLRASSRAETVADPARARAWFFRILRRTIVDHHRERKPAGESLEVEPAAPVEEALSACACAVRLLDELRPGHAEVLRAVDFDGEEPAAVATRLGLTRGNLDVRLHRARRELREKVMRHCGVDGAAPCLDCTCDASSCCGGERAPSKGKSTMHPSEKLVRAWVAAFYGGDAETARRHLADDVAFVGPSAQFHGADALVRTMGHVAPGVERVEIERVFVDGDEVALFYDLVLDHAVRRMSIAEWDTLRDGKIASIRLVLDTGPFTPRAPKGELAVDPVCSMRVAKSSAAATRVHRGKTYWFCAEGCASTFDREPDRYA